MNRNSEDSTDQTSKADLEALSSQLSAGLVNLRQELRGDTDALGRRMDLMNTNTDALSQRVEQVTNNTDALGRRIDKLSSDTDALGHRIDKIGQQSEALSDRMDHMNKNSDALSERVDQLAKNSDALSERVDQLGQSLDEIVSGSAQEVLHAVADRFDNMDATLARIEGKLDPTIDQVDGHELRIQALEGAA